MSGLSFAAPAYLIGLTVVLVGGSWALARSHRRFQESLDLFGDGGLLAESSVLASPRVRSARAALRLAALALLLLALARPQLGEREVGMQQSGRDLLVVLDLSRSMNAAEGGATRLSLAKQTVQELLAASPHNRVGLIVFGGSAFLQLPLTTNYAAFERYLAAASTDDLGDPGTSLPNALQAAAATFEHEGERGYQSVLLLSDGESGSSDVGTALTRLTRAHIQVFAIGIGNTQGAPVPADSSEAPEQWHRDHIGRIVMSRLEEADLRRAARETGGSYRRWSPGLGRVLALDLAQLGRRPLASGDSLERVDRFQWPLALAVALLLLEPMLRARRRSAVA
jgi:Ca-activated chloride channel family protein